VDFVAGTLNEDREVEIVIVIDTCLAHNNVPVHAANMKVVFVVPNYTSNLQGVIHVAKVHYRSQRVQ
jgi:hypothetical protein